MAKTEFWAGYRASVLSRGTDGIPFGRDWAVGLLYDNLMEKEKDPGQNIEDTLQFLKRMWVTEIYDQLTDQKRYQIMWASPMGDNLQAVMEVTADEATAVETWMVLKFSEVRSGST